nr:hypothetical protein [Bacillus cereus]
MVANYINNYVYKTQVIRYEKMVDDLKTEDVNEKFRKMQTYNKLLGKTSDEIYNKRKMPLQKN